MNCIIIDDDIMTQNLLSNYVERSGLISCIGTFNNPVEVQEILRNQKIDLIFLDIEMPEMNGLDFLEYFSSKQQIIIISANDKHALSTFEYYNVTDYLLKPISIERFKKSLDKFIDKYVELNSCCINNNIFVKHNENYVKICLEDIHYIEFLEDNAIFETIDRNFCCTNQRMMESLITKDEFVRINNSVLMNIRYIIEIKNAHVKILSNGNYKSVAIESEFLANLEQKFKNKNK